MSPWFRNYAEAVAGDDMYGGAILVFIRSGVYCKKNVQAEIHR